MAGTRKKPGKNGKIEGWFANWQGGRTFFYGTTIRKETEAIARKLEDKHLQIRLGYLPAPKTSDTPRAFDEISAEYIAWGASQGGRGGRPWCDEHTGKRRAFLAFWQKRLGLATLKDLDGILPRVEEALRELGAGGRAGKTLNTYADGLASFCDWCVKRGYLDADPLKGLAQFDKTAKTTRRAMTPDEIKRLLEACLPQRRIVYEVALTSGLRANELRSLKVANLDIERGGLRLDANWTKARKDGFQPLPGWLVAKLAESAKGKEQSDKLLFVPMHPHRPFKHDLDRAKISKWAPGGKLDFHALRVAYVTMTIETGANAKEVQSLARHSTPSLTMNTYGRTRDNRLASVAELVGDIVNPGPKCVAGVGRVAAGAESTDVKACDRMALACVGTQQGSGIRILPGT